ncbi:MAG: DUF1054 family protein [Sporolactobacillus sp.]
MPFSGFSEDDFRAMRIDGLDPRMTAIKKQIQPKFSQLAEELLTDCFTAPFYAHIARHARRTVNPPDSTWVAFSCSKRSYKKFPHFQFGIWPTHLFFWLALIEEYPAKALFADYLLEHEKQIISRIPDRFSWSPDHTEPSAYVQHELKSGGLTDLFQRLKSVKKAEILCGFTISKERAARMDGEVMISQIKQGIDNLWPLYEAALQTMKQTSL